MGSIICGQQQIVALSAELKKFKNKSTSSNENSSKSNNGGKDANQQNKNGGKKNTKKKKSTKKKDNDSKWAWKRDPPANGETTKTVENKTYYWCPKHKAWTLYKPSECRLGENSNDDNSEPSNVDTTNSDFTFASALATIEAESQE